MVDTICIVIHNLKNYKGLYEQFYVTNRKKNTVVQGFNMVDSDGVVSQEERSYVASRFYQDSGKFLPSAVSFDLHAPSHNYIIRCRIVHKDVDEAKLEVEFSLPKYFYGTNVFQILGFPEYSSEGNYLKLIKCIRTFMAQHFFQVPHDRDIQIKRLDLCYNQFFQNKIEALTYQAAQKPWAKEFCEAKNMRFIDGHGSNWSIVTDRYSFKCYHKGTEFLKHDLVELRKNRRSPYNLRDLSQIADRILRYEVTFRGSMLHYLTTYNFFENQAFKEPHYIKNDNLFIYIKRAAKHPLLNGLPDFDRKVISPVDYFCSKIKSFHLKSAFDRPFNPMVILSDSVTFNYPVYRILFDFFWKKVRAVQVDSRSSVPEMVEKIKEYDSNCAKRKGIKGMVKPGDMKKKGGVHLGRLLVPALLCQYLDLRQLKKFLPSSTYKNLMRDLKFCGIPMKSENINIVKPSLCYKDNLIYLVPFIRHQL